MLAQFGVPLTDFFEHQDHKTRSIEYSHATCLWIVQIHCMYVHVMGIFALFLFFSQVSLVPPIHIVHATMLTFWVQQVDFAMIRLLADLLVTGYSTVWFIQVSPSLRMLFTCSKTLINICNSRTRKSHQSLLLRSRAWRVFPCSPL